MKRHQKRTLWLNQDYPAQFTCSYLALGPQLHYMITLASSSSCSAATFSST
uniref:Uncharacterized protein n=1 Tax=Anguilla anguilla TaxID=7936 RepID=A0A0E9V4Z4_ANGAN